MMGNDKLFSWFKFNQLTPAILYDILALRQDVFIVEQNCPYRDLDGLDPHAWHLTARSESGELLACLRLIEPGHKYSEPSLGRVVTSLEVRRTGFGRQIMEEGIRKASELYPGAPIRICAQVQAGGFYRRLGFRPVSDIFDEDGIPHVEMVRGEPVK